MGMRRMMAAATALVAIALALPPGGEGPHARAEPVPEIAPWVVAGGDIACSRHNPRPVNECHELETSRLFGPGGTLSGLPGTDLTGDHPNDVGVGLRGVLALGDLQYDDARYDDFTYQDVGCPTGAAACSFDQSWMAAAAASGVKIYPTPGNHEYQDTGDTCSPGSKLRPACGYDEYFHSPKFQGAYDFVAGTDGYGDYTRTFAPTFRGTHPMLFISVNTGLCDQEDHDHCAKDARPGTPGNQPGPIYRFLHDTLASPAVDPGRDCVVVFYHEPRFSAYYPGDQEWLSDIWELMFPATNPDLSPARRPDLVLSGHSHSYQRFPPLGPGGAVDPANGLPEIIVGTGGRNLLEPHVGSRAGDPARTITQKFGLLKLNWSYQSGRIRVSFYEAEDGTVVDPVRPRRMIRYDCHT